MPAILNVYALPSLVAEEELAHGTAVVIDVLRASTTIVFALEAGAREVVPCLEIDEARAAAEQFERDEVVTGGERHGLPIDGFDLGNSPSEYTPERVGGKTVVLTTTNGTRAILRCRKAERVLIGALVNASAVYEQLLDQQQVNIVCAGTDGQFSRDDVLLAGLLVERLQRRSGLIYQLNAQAITARENWLAAFSVPAALGAEPLEPERVADQLRNSPGGQNLTAIGLDDDILTAAEIDRFPGVPELVPGQMRIRLRAEGD
jgi:2-phosphosulfolactate phosphatase